MVTYILDYYILRESERTNMENNLERWVSMKEITAYLGINRDTVLNWIEKRGMPAVKVGRLWKIKISEVDAWMKAGHNQCLDGLDDRQGGKNDHC